jgi:adenylate cyclase
MAQSLLPVFLRTLDAALRQQIVKVTEQMWSTDEEISAVTMKRTVGFVDLVDFTTTTTRLSVRELTQVLIAFDQLTGEVVARGNGQIVKTIGDEAMFVTEGPTEACRIARDLVDASGDQHPQLRVGVACGEMISVFGDLYGQDVNLAARLVAAAEPGTAFVSERVRAAVGGFGFDLLPTLNLKGFPGPTPAYRLGSDRTHGPTPLAPP